MEVLHRDERRAVVRETVIEDLHDVRTASPRGERRFALEARDDIGVGRMSSLDEFHDDLRLQRQVIRQPNTPHAAFSEQAGKAYVRRYEVTRAHAWHQIAAGLRQHHLS